MHDAAELDGSGLAKDGRVDQEREEVDSPVFGAEAGGRGTREPGDASVKLGNGPSPCGALDTIPRVVGPLGSNALEEGGSDSKGNPEVGSTGGNDFQAERREGEGGSPELSAGGRNNGSFDGAGAWNAHHSGAGRPIGTKSCGENGKGEIAGDAGDGEQARVWASLTDSHRESMQDSSSAIAQVSCSEP